MTTTTNVAQVKLNVMTQSQYNSATKNPTELYMITDAKVNYDDLDNKPTIPTESTVSGWGFTKNVGTVTSVNNTQPDANGNVTVLNTTSWGNIAGTLSNQTDLQNALDTKANSASLATVATSGSYNDLSDKPTIPAAQVNADWNASSGVAQILNKPTIPTVNNATLTIQKNGTTVKTFTANASTNVTANITVPTKTSDITNDSGYITGISSSDVTTALGYTPLQASDISNMVTTNTQQNINAIKTFSTDMRFIRSSSDLTTQATSNENWVGPRFVDNNDVQGALVQYRRLSTGVAETNIQTRALSTQNFSKIAIYKNPDGTAYTETPTPTEDTTSSIQIDTVGARNTKLANYATTSAMNSVISSSPYLVLYGTSTSAADATAKIVEISSSYATTPTISAGQILIVTPTITSTVADSTITIQKSSTTLLAAKTMRYNNANITTSTDSIVWRANTPSIFVYDGTYWVFAGHGYDENTTYSAMSVSEGTTGTATSSRVMRADYLKQIIEGLAISQTNTYYDSASSTLYIG